ncbi:hypothetical protein [Bradyrhizobium sp. WSM1417]|uniref:hypothetical protein n=1 Tax=Bradyrhizobium sp. WSM1417 TaxID=754500 RepID=UPI0012EC9229|nr:hypothetical protein [Bradyrhizobium sp. WSM1417]
MPAFGKIAKPAALIVVAATFLSLSGTARAETGWLWFDSVFAAPRAAPVSTGWRPVHAIKRAKIARPAVTQAPTPKPILVSAASDARPNCFWCGRPVYVSGLSF